jgi:hypothetical protein
MDIKSAIVEENDDGSASVSFEYEAGKKIVNINKGHYDNLVDLFDENTLETVAYDVIQTTDADKSSRQAWEDTLVKGMELLGIKLDEGSGVFEGACTAHHPLIIESAIKSQAKLANELLPAKGPVKCQIVGEQTEAKEKQAMRVQNFMNYDLTEIMEEYYPDKEKTFLAAPLLGSCFSKTYFDGLLQRKVTEMVLPDVFVVPSNAVDLRRCPRYTHIIYKTKFDMIKDVEVGLYSSQDIGEPAQANLTPLQTKINELMGLSNCTEYDEVYTLYEQHVDMIFEELGDTIPRPYVITVEKTSNKVLSIRRNWREKDKTYQKKINFTHYPFVPSLCFYGYGYIHLLGNLEITLTSVMRALVDSGQFANLQGGFKNKNARIVGSNDAIGPGEFRDVEIPAMTRLGDAFIPLPFKEPSAVLFNLLQFIEGRAQKFADSTEQVIADSTNYGPVGTTLALLEASTKFFSFIHKNFHRAMRQEFKIMAELNKEYLPEEYPYDVTGETRTVFKRDFDDRVDIIPVSDPNIPSQAHRVAMAQTQLQIAQQFPQQHDIPLTLRSIYRNMGFENVDKLIPLPESAVPQDPLTDIISASQGKPIKAFKGQDHDAHIAVKMNYLQDPKAGASPILQSIAPVIQANIMEHTVMKYAEMMNAAGAKPEDAASQAQAAQQLTQLNQIAQQVEAQGGLENPAVILAQAEMKQAENEAERIEDKTASDMARLAVENRKVDLEILKEMNKNKQFYDKLEAEMDKERFKKGADLAEAALLRLKEESEENKVDKPTKE